MTTFNEEDIKGFEKKSQIIPMSHTQLLEVVERTVKDNIAVLDLSNRGITHLPSEIGRLKDLTVINLNFNQLTKIPAEIGQLSNLGNLSLAGNLLIDLPPEIGLLSRLTDLRLDSNRLERIPPEIGQLTQLIALNLSVNRLTKLPPEISQLINLVRLNLDFNKLISPPPEVIKQGPQAIRTYFREGLEASSRQWISKLLVVGEGGVGKTSLLRSLRDEEFDPQESTTHGIDIRTLAVVHPVEANVTMRLSTWDFGGQEIYHATHQFFLTNRSLFLLVWNARHGFEQGKLYYWLDTMQALAPESPILLVATHIDQRDAELPFTELRRKYPQIIGHSAISNLTGVGVAILRQAIADAAANLPLMGEVWPTTWLNAADAIRKSKEKHITPSQMWQIMASHNINEKSASILARWLHELGDILYFPDNDDLKDIVIFKPQWVTAYISKVLESEEVINTAGIFTRGHMDKIWSDLEPPMREHFLRLMERFDLSYQTLDNREISLIVERLPLDQPNYERTWNDLRASGNSNEITMKFRLNTIPAGIPTWFIARSHRFTTHTHWRNGALFSYESQRQHLALVQAFPHDRYIELTVRGPQPHNFFALLKDGIELTLARFPGLQITRSIPCPGHEGQHCSHEFDYEDLLNRITRKPIIECPKSLEDVYVTELIFGLHWSTQNNVLSRIRELEATIVQNHQETLNEIRQLQALTQREFINAFRREQSFNESHCPNVFALRPYDIVGWRQFFEGAKKTVIGQRFQLQLYCQAPGHWHPTASGGLYEIDNPAAWFKIAAPYLRRLFGVLKYAAPLAGSGLAWAAPSVETIFKNDIGFSQEIINKLPELTEDSESGLAHSLGPALEAEQIYGASLRALRLLLESKGSKTVLGRSEKGANP